LAFFGHGGAVYKSPGFANPAGLTIGHWLTLPQGVTRTEAIARLEPHKLLLRASFEEFGKSAKYTLDICDDAYEKQVKESVLRILPRGQYYAIELLQFTSRADGFDFRRSIAWCCGRRITRSATSRPASVSMVESG
jgi:hypothetical protein